MCTELLTGAEPLSRMAHDGTDAPRLRMVAVVTRVDEVATPYTTGIPAGPNVTTIDLQAHCPTDYVEHLQLTSDPAVESVVHQGLEGRDPAPVCPAGS